MTPSDATGGSLGTAEAESWKTCSWGGSGKPRNFAAEHVATREKMILSSLHGNCLVRLGAEYMNCLFADYCRYKILYGTMENQYIV